MSSTMYGVICLTTFSSVHELQILSIASAFSHAQSIKASPVMTAFKTAKLFPFFFTDHLNFDVF